MKAETMNIIKMLSKPTTERMPFQGVELTKFLQRIPFFKRMFQTQSEQFITLCLSATLKGFQPSEDIYEKEISPNSIYIILEGKIYVQSKTTKVSRIVQAFDVLGNVEVVFEMCERAETTKTQSEVTCMILNAKPLLKILKQKEEIMKGFHYLRINSYFESLSDYDKKSLTLLMKKEYFQKRETIVYEGQFNKKVFFIIHGKVNITTKIPVDGKEQEVLLDSIEEMDSHGEYQCLKNVKSDVRMIAATTGSYYSIEIDEAKEKKNLFLNCVKEHAYPYPDKEELQFRFKIEANIEKQKQKIAKKLKLYH